MFCTILEDSDDDDIVIGTSRNVVHPEFTNSTVGGKVPNPPIAHDAFVRFNPT